MVAVVAKTATLAVIGYVDPVEICVPPLIAFIAQDDVSAYDAEAIELTNDAVTAWRTKDAVLAVTT